MPDETNLTAPVPEVSAQGSSGMGVSLYGEDKKPTEPSVEVEVKPSVTEDPLVSPEKTEEALVQQAEAQKLLTEVGLDFEAFSKEYEDTGELSEASVKNLVDAGVPEPLVKAYVAGLEAQVNAFATQIKTHFGGEQEFEKLANYIRTLGDEQLNVVNKTLGMGDINQAKELLEGYKARMVLKHGTSNPTVMGTGVTTGTKGFETKAEKVAAINDPRYTKDPKYRAEVQKRILASHKK